MTDIERWAASEDTIKRSQRFYAHFDFRTDLSKCWDYISKPDNIASHGFYPFIHYRKKTIKFSKDDGRKVKDRDICYAAHIDRCIYQYYNYLLSSHYNNECKRLGIDNVAVAYRNNMKGKSNIHFAKRAFDFIRSFESCYVMIGDFTKFFDRLDHNYLKEQWCNLLHKAVLTNDHYAVYKSITQYSYVEMKTILRVLNLEDNDKGRIALNKKSRIFTPSEFKSKQSLIHKNKDAGIPQGSPMSGALANIYMLEADKEINDFVAKQNGLYMRYSDDFIIVLPDQGQEERDTTDKLIHLQSVFNSSKYPGLELQMSKTQYYYYNSKNLQNCGAIVDPHADSSNRYINFLGFTFDGNKISIRAKTISKYYYRMRKKAKTISMNGHYTKKGKHISGKNIYMKYSERGATGKKGNFLTYVKRSKTEFGPNELIDKDTKNNMSKIRKAMKKKY